MRRIRVWFGVLAVVSVLVSACAGATSSPTPVPTTAPTTAPTSAPQETASPTTAAAATATTEATSAPTTSATSAPVTFDFWAAPNPPQVKFWKDMATAYMQEYPNVTVNVSAMPESPTSEAAIQTAIAGGTAPAASENIFIGFGATLYDSQAVVPLNQMPGWDQLISDRHMEEAVKGWQYPDNNFYVLPEYANAMLWGWRIDIMQSIGYDNVPLTYSDVLTMAETLKQQDPKKFLWARAALVDPTWWQRWFDFYILYDAASNGQPLITGNQITADDQAAIEVLTFMQDLAKNNLVLTQQAQNPLETGLSISDALGPWTFPTWATQFPDLKYGETYTLSMPIRPDGVAPADVKTFADSKGLVIYAQASSEQQQAAWDFIRWTFSDPQHDLTWLQQTALPPVRGDLATNSLFQSYFQDNPELVPYAANIPNAVPPFANPNYVEIQRLLGTECQIPVINGEKDPQTGWNDWKSAVQTQVFGQ